LTRQDLRGTALHVLLIALSVAGASCLPTVVSRLLRPGDVHRPRSKSVVLVILSTFRVTLVTGSVLSLLSLGIIRGLPADNFIAPEMAASDVRRWASQALQTAGYRPYADVTEGIFSQLPLHDDWSEDSLKKIHGARLNQVSLRYSRAYHSYLVNARLWRANLEGAYLSEADLRGANLREARLHDAVLDRAQASHAVLVSADARNVNFSSADLHGADLSYAILENAVLSNGNFSSASMYGVDLREAQLLRTDLSRTDLRDAKVENAMLSLTNLQNADFSGAKLMGATMTRAQFRGGIFLDTNLKNADLRGAFLGGAIVRDAHFEGVNFEGADLRGAIGLTAEQVCSSASWRGALLDPDVLAIVQTRCGPAFVGPVKP
jgi:uncharacterized protein YjbI with pentapeptide repeats